MGAKGIFTNWLASPSRSKGSYQGLFNAALMAATCSSVASAAMRRSAAVPSTAVASKLAEAGMAKWVSAVRAKAYAPTADTWVRSTLVSKVPAKALSPISVTPSPKVREETLLFSNRRSGILPWARVTSLRLLSPAKDPAGRREASQRTVSFFSPVSPSKAPSPMLVTESGMVSSSRFAQLAKALAPMDVTESNRSIP